jgi:hypothetical protein
LGVAASSVDYLTASFDPAAFERMSGDLIKTVDILMTSRDQASLDASAAAFDVDELLEEVRTTMHQSVLNKSLKK